MYNLLQSLLTIHVSLDKNSKIRNHLAKAIRIATADYLNEGRESKGPKITDLEIALGRQNGKIAAIKEVRTRLGYGLKDAKDFVEAEFKRLGYNFYDGYVPTYS